MEERILTAPDGFYYRSKIEPEVFGKKIVLGSIDSPDNWELVKEEE
jgi:hypothetical protein